MPSERDPNKSLPASFRSGSSPLLPGRPDVIYRPAIHHCARAGGGGAFIVRPSEPRGTTEDQFWTTVWTTVWATVRSLLSDNHRSGAGADRPPDGHGRDGRRRPNRRKQKAERGSESGRQICPAAGVSGVNVSWRYHAELEMTRDNQSSRAEL